MSIKSFLNPPPDPPPLNNLLNIYYNIFYKNIIRFPPKKYLKKVLKTLFFYNSGRVQGGK